jgi:photosystem II stability/assembly factor-like uncharacterized protein
MSLRYSVVVLTLSFLFIVGPSQAQVSWVETAYPGEARVTGAYTQIEVDPIGRVYGLVGKGPTIVRTTNGGRDWTFYDGPNTTLNGLEFFSGQLYASSEQGLFVSSNLTDWEQVALPGNATRIEWIDADKGVLIVKIVNDSRLIFKRVEDEGFLQVRSDIVTPFENALTPYGSSSMLHLSAKGLWKYDFATAEWSKLSAGMRAIDMTVILDTLYIASRHDVSETPYLSKSPIGTLAPLEIMISGNLQFRRMYTMHDTLLVAWRRDSVTKADEIHFSFDRRELSPPLQTADYSMTDMALRSGQFYASTVGGLHVNTAYMFEDWAKLSTRLEANVARKLIALPDNSIIAATSRGWILRSTNGGNSWEEQKMDLPGVPTLLAYTPAGTLLLGIPGQLLASRDNGRTFVGSDEGFSRRTPQAFAIGKDEKLFLGTDSGLYYSTDDGATWFMPRSENMTIVSPDQFLPEVYSIAVDPNNNSMYVGTNRGVLYSLNEGEKYESGWLAKSPIYAVAVNPWGEVYAGSTSITASDPNKRNFYRGWDVLREPTAWIAPSHVIDDYDLDKLMLNSKGQIISGVLFSHNGGTNWEIGSIEGKGSPKSVVAQTIDKNDIAYVSIGDKVYKSAGPKLNVDPIGPKRQELSVYPNPAANSIRFADGVQGDVTLFNALGESVLSTRVFPSHSIDIRHLPAGSYICQLTSSAGLSRMPLVVVR